MNNFENEKHFLLIRPDQIKFAASNQKNEIFFEKKFRIQNLEFDENLQLLENFLDENVIDIEKKIKRYIKDIFLIIDHKKFLTIDLSSTYNFKSHFKQMENIPNSLMDLKNYLRKHTIDYEITHMMIKKFIVGEKEYLSMPKELNQESIFLEIRFICLKINFYRNLKNIFKKYQINIKNVLCYDYVTSFEDTINGNLFDIAEKLINGSNKNEILFVNKTPKNQGFFEKFFNFFN